MTTEEKNIKICEHRGWQRHEKFRRWRFLGEGELVHAASLPDHFNDLNAIHEAVIQLPNEIQDQFRKELQWMIAPETKPGPVCGIVLMNNDSYRQWFNATATQRAEAFLRTLNLWKP